MRHARPDYARIVDLAALNPSLVVTFDAAMEVLAQRRPMNDHGQQLYDALFELTKVLHPSMQAVRAFTGRPIAADEPVFLIRATDMTGPDAVCAWGRLQYEQKGNREMSRFAVDHADTMRAWQRVHGSKVADMPMPDTTAQGDGASHG